VGLHQLVVWSSQHTSRTLSGHSHLWCHFDTWQFWNGPHVHTWWYNRAPLNRYSIFVSLFSPQLEKYQKAFEHLGNALTYDPNNYTVCSSLHCFSTFVFAVHCILSPSPRWWKCLFSPVLHSSFWTLVPVPRPSWLQGAWCRPTGTLTWPWTSTAWRPAACRRARPSGTTSACASLARRNTWRWVTICLLHLSEKQSFDDLQLRWQSHEKFNGSISLMLEASQYFPKMWVWVHMQILDFTNISKPSWWNVWIIIGPV